MTPRVPPRLAVWLLGLLGPHYQRESLAGDLYEQFQEGRSRRWFWRQVLTAVRIGCAALVIGVGRHLASHRSIVIHLKRLVGLFLLFALSAGTVTWATGNSHLLAQCVNPTLQCHGR